VPAVFLCAGLLVAAPAQASTDPAERVALREALTRQAHAAGSRVVKLPLPEAPRASAAAGRSELAAIASSQGPERVLVGVRTHADVAGVAARLRALGAQPELFDTIAVLAATVPSGAEAVAALRDDPRVAYVERDRTLRTAVEPFDIDDPALAAGGISLKYTWAYDTVRAGEAIAAVAGGSARTVAVIDTGLDVNHPEFVGQVQRVFDTDAGDTNVTDIVGHGTFVTGLIAALDGNGQGAKGVAGNTKVIAVRASRDAEGTFSLSDLIAGIEFSIRQGADVINMSLAGQGFTRSHARALEVAFFNDVLPVAASGNNAENGNPLEFPAAAVGGVQGGRGIGLSVAATKPDGGVASFSDHNDFVSLAAPGASPSDCRFGVFSTIPASTNPPWQQNGCPNVFTDQGASYAYGEGTSFAAPIVSGLAALAWQAERRLASEQVADVLVRSANGGGWNEFTGAGVVDGMRAVEIARAYDVLGPRARGSVRRRAKNRVRVTVARSSDRTLPGDETAGAVTYGLLVSRDGGRNYSVVASRRRRPFSKVMALKGTRFNVFVSTACDGNVNCGVKRLGRLRRRR
jgi:subtilisin family serine protease